MQRPCGSVTNTVMKAAREFRETPSAGAANININDNFSVITHIPAYTTAHPTRHCGVLQPFGAMRATLPGFKSHLPITFSSALI